MPKVDEQCYMAWHYLIVYNIVSTMGKRDPSVEYLTFINHTECHCISRQNRSSVHGINQHHSHHHLTTAAISSTASNAADGVASGGIQSQSSNNNCQCVKHFKVFYERVEVSDDEDDDDDVGVVTSNHMCRCDCDVDDVSCDWLKKGKDGFSIEDRRCIVDKRCLRPACEYGQYSIQMGRCPKLEDKLAGARNLFFD